MFQIVILICSAAVLACTEENAASRIVYPDLVPTCQLLQSEQYLADVSNLLPDGAQARFMCIHTERS